MSVRIPRCSGDDNSMLVTLRDMEIRAYPCFFFPMPLPLGLAVAALEADAGAPFPVLEVSDSFGFIWMIFLDRPGGGGRYKSSRPRAAWDAVRFFDIVFGVGKGSAGDDCTDDLGWVFRRSVWVLVTLSRSYTGDGRSKVRSCWDGRTSSLPTKSADAAGVGGRVGAGILEAFGMIFSNVRRDSRSRRCW